MDLVGLADQAHRALTVLAAVAAAGVLGLSPLGLLVARSNRPVPPPLRAAIDWLIVLVPLLVAAAAAFGLLLFVATAGPRDGLHAVYGAVALVGLPLARILGAGPPLDIDDDAGRAPAPAAGELTGRLVTWLVLGAIVTLGALLRLAGTG
ncbi:MAG: hypothetical protein FIA92_00885 [Chloroflexi bacterium]|nr:hypothetical protein [Chloroflexota bacterium]